MAKKKKVFENHEEPTDLPLWVAGLTQRARRSLGTWSTSLSPQEMITGEVVGRTLNASTAAGLVPTVSWANRTEGGIPLQRDVPEAGGSLWF